MPDGDELGMSLPRRESLAPPGVDEPHGDAAEVDDGVLHRELHALALAGGLALPERGHHAEGRVHARAGVADGRAGLQRRRAGEAGERHGAAGGLRDHVEALVLAVRAVAAEALDREVDDPRVDLRQRVVAEAELLHGARRLVLGDDVRVLDHVEEHGLALRILEVQRDAPLVGVERQEVARVHAGLLGAAVAARLALAGLLHLDDVGAQPGQQLGARGSRLELGQVEHADAVQGFAHGRHHTRPSGAWATAGRSARTIGGPASASYDCSRSYRDLPMWNAPRSIVVCVARGGAAGSSGRSPTVETKEQGS